MEIDALVGELLASARLDFAAMSLHSLDAADVARRALERAGLPPETMLDAGAGQGDGEPADLGFSGDPTLIARALANLLDNARKHGGGAKRLRVRREPAAIAFEVDDDGPGFPAPGVQTSGQRPEGSLGLGLVLVRRIADAHRGSLTLANRPEGGARARLVVAVAAPV
jgi:signal transduction histidine kinase